MIAATIIRISSSGAAQIALLNKQGFFLESVTPFINPYI